MPFYSEYSKAQPPQLLLPAINYRLVIYDNTNPILIVNLCYTLYFMLSFIFIVYFDYFLIFKEPLLTPCHINPPASISSQSSSFFFSSSLSADVYDFVYK